MKISLAVDGIAVTARNRAQARVGNAIARRAAERRNDLDATRDTTSAPLDENTQPATRGR